MSKKTKQCEKAKEDITEWYFFIKKQVRAAPSAPQFFLTFKPQPFPLHTQYLLIPNFLQPDKFHPDITHQIKHNLRVREVLVHFLRNEIMYARSVIFRFFLFEINFSNIDDFSTDKVDCASRFGI